MIKRKQSGPTSEELFWRTTDQVVDHLNRQTRSDPAIKRERVTMNSLREDVDEFRDGVDRILLDETARREVSPSLWNERDVMFQIRVMDWMIGFCVVVLGVVLCVGFWAIWMMVTRGWLW